MGGEGFFQFNSIILLAIIKQKAKAFDCKDDRDTFEGLSPNSATKGHGSTFKRKTSEIDLKIDVQKEINSGQSQKVW